MDVLDRDLLLALAAVAIERFEQRGVGPGELVRWPSNVCSLCMARR
jgi:hypothetical protein